MNRVMTLALALTTVPVFAQQPSPAPPAPPTHDSTSRNRRVEVRIPNFDGFSTSSTMGIVPAGTWWRNADTIKTLNLTLDQQKKMDDILRQNRIQLIDVKASLEKEQLNLEPILDTNPPDTAKALVEISKIADLRADLEKANARMLLSLRAQLTADQWTRLQALHPASTPYTFTMPNIPKVFFKSGEANTSTTTTCTQKSGEADANKRCTTTTVTMKDDAGHPVITTCVQTPGQTTPRCTTAPTGLSNFNLNLPLEDLAPAAFPMNLDLSFADLS